MAYELTPEMAARIEAIEAKARTLADADLEMIFQAVVQQKNCHLIGGGISYTPGKGGYRKRTMRESLVSCIGAYVGDSNGEWELFVDPEPEALNWTLVRTHRNRDGEVIGQSMICPNEPVGAEESCGSYMWRGLAEGAATDAPAA